MSNKSVENIPVYVGDIIMDNNGKYHKTLIFCTNLETNQIMVVFEAIKGKTTWTVPVASLTSDKYLVAISAEDLES